MAELLVRVVDKAHGSGRTQAEANSRAGDVIVVCPDGWGWGKAEVSNPEWRIFKMPGIPTGALQELTTTDHSRIAGQEFLKRKRVRYLDLSGSFARGLIHRGQVVELTPAEAAQLLTLRRTKAQLIEVG